jgi:hypothetical protein
MKIKFYLFFLLVIFALFSCSKAFLLSYEKNRDSENNGLTRIVKAYSSYTGQIIFERKFLNSYFENESSGDCIKVNILDLKNGLKTNIIGNNVIIIFDEISE